MKFEKLDSCRPRLGDVRGQARSALRKPGLKRIAAQEYAPFAAWVLAWAALVAALGLTNAVWLLAANGFVQAIRSLFLAQSFDAISARLHGPADLRARARRLALQVDVSVLLASLALLLPAAAGLAAIGLVEIAATMLIMAIGLPARTPAVLMLDRRNIGTTWRLGSATTMVAGSSLVLLLGWHWVWAALVLALRDWGGLVAVWLVRKSWPAPPKASPGHLGFAEIAARTSMAARRRLVYRIGKVALSILGPLGSVIARTSRGTGLDKRFARRLRVNPIAVGLLAMACILATLALIATRIPPSLLIAAATARLAAAALSVLIWWRWFEASDAFPDWLNDDL